MKSSEVCFGIVITCFLIHITHGIKYGNTSIPANNKKNKEITKSLQTLPASSNQLEASASSQDVISFLQNLNETNILNIGSSTDAYLVGNDGRSDIFTVAIPLSQLKALEESGLVAQELSLSDLNKLTENLQQYGLTVDEHDHGKTDSFQNPIHINLTDVTYASTQLTKQDADQSGYYNTNNIVNNLGRNSQNFQNYHQDNFNLPSQPNSNKQIENTTVNHNIYETRGIAINDPKDHNSYSRVHPEEITAEPVKFNNDANLQIQARGQNRFNPKQSNTKKFNEYDAFPEGAGQFSNTDLLKVSHERSGNAVKISNEHHLKSENGNSPQRLHQYPIEHGYQIQDNSGNSQNRKISSNQNFSPVYTLPNKQNEHHSNGQDGDSPHRFQQQSIEEYKIQHNNDNSQNQKVSSNEHYSGVNTFPNQQNTQHLNVKNGDSHHRFHQHSIEGEYQVQHNTGNSHNRKMSFNQYYSNVNTLPKRQNEHHTNAQDDDSSHRLQHHSIEGEYQTQHNNDNSQNRKVNSNQYYSGVNTLPNKQNEHHSNSKHSDSHHRFQQHSLVNEHQIQHNSDNFQNRKVSSNQHYSGENMSQNTQNKRHSNIENGDSPQRLQQYSTLDGHQIQHNNGNIQNKEIISNNPYSGENTFPNRHHESFVSYAAPKMSDKANFQNTVAAQNKHHSSDASSLPADIDSNIFGANIIINRIGDVGVDEQEYNKDVQEQGYYKGDDGSERFGSIPGILGVDYPNYLSIPNTRFDCRQYNYPGYFADVEAQCQVYHICQADGRRHSFLCPVGTLFNQKVLVCDWWYNTDCASSDSFFDRNAQIYQESINANNYKGHHQPNIQLTNTRSERNLRGSDIFDNYKVARISQNINNFDNFYGTQTEYPSLSDERKSEEKDDWRNMNDFSRQSAQKFNSARGDEVSNEKHFHSGYFDHPKVERMDQNINLYSDDTETYDENLNLPNVRRNNHNNWMDVPDDDPNESPEKYAPNMNIATLNDKYLRTEQKTNTKQIESLPFEESHIDRTLDSWIKTDRSSNLRDNVSPIDKTMHRSEEKGKYKEHQLDILMPSFEDRADTVIEPSTMQYGNKLINKIVDRAVTLSKKLKSDANLENSEVKVQNREVSNSPSIYESQYFGESERTKQQNENSHEEEALKNSAQKSKENTVSFEDRHKNSEELEEIGIDESEEQSEEYDERLPIKGEFVKDTVSEEDDSEYDANEESDSSLQVLDPVSNLDTSIRGGNILVDRVLNAPLSNSELQLNHKSDSNRIKLNNEAITGEEIVTSNVSLTGVMEQRGQNELENSIYKNLETFDVPEIINPKLEPEENHSSYNVNDVKSKEAAENNDRMADKGPPIEKLGMDEIRSERVDRVRDMMTDLASGDRLYRNILISEVISPHYRNNIRHDEYRPPTFTKVYQNSNKEINIAPLNSKFDDSEISAIIETENNQRRIENSETTTVISDLIIDAAESRLQETLIKPHEKIIVKIKSDGKNGRTYLRQAENSTKISRSRFNDTAKRKLVRRKLRQELKS